MIVIMLFKNKEIKSLIDIKELIIVKKLKEIRFYEKNGHYWPYPFKTIKQFTVIY